MKGDETGQFFQMDPNGNLSLSGWFSVVFFFFIFLVLLGSVLSVLPSQRRNKIVDAFGRLKCYSFLLSKSILWRVLAEVAFSKDDDFP